MQMSSLLEKKMETLILFSVASLNCLYYTVFTVELSIMKIIPFQDYKYNCECITNIFDNILFK